MITEPLRIPLRRNGNYGIMGAGDQLTIPCGHPEERENYLIATTVDLTQDHKPAFSDVLYILY